MLYVVKGDLLKSDCNIIAHQANCFKTFGAGIARQIKSVYPEAFRADIDYPFSAEDRLGRCSYAFSRNGVIVYNLYGQYTYGTSSVKTKNNAFKSSLTMMLEDLKLKGVPVNVKIGLPYKIGCVRGGGNWSQIEPIIEELFYYFERDIYLYDY